MRFLALPGMTDAFVTSTKGEVFLFKEISPIVEMTALMNAICYIANQAMRMKTRNMAL
jgi:hypothetical protein